MAVVVTGIAAKDPLQMPSVYNEEVVETLGADGPDEALRISIRVRCPKWSQKDLGTLGSEDLVEADHVLRITVSDEEPWVQSFVGEVTGQVPRLLGDPRAIGMLGDPSDPDSPTPDLDEEQDVEPPEQHRI